MPATSMVSLRCPTAEREAIERLRAELSIETGRTLSLSDALLYVLRRGIEAHRGQ